MTAVGPLTLPRTYFNCPTCGQGDFGADRVLGIAGYVTAGACRMASLLGVQQSFEKAQRALAGIATIGSTFASLSENKVSGWMRQGIFRYA